MINKLYKFYQYLFYKFYMSNIWTSRCTEPYPYQAAWFTLSFLIWSYFLTFLMILEILTGYGFSQLQKFSKLNIVAMSTSFKKFNNLGSMSS